MDSMMSGDMSKMMSSSSKMSSSSFSSSSSSTSTQMGSTMLGGGMQMPSLGNMGGIGSLDIEELSTAGTDFSGPPEYTVTSPRPSVVAGNVAGEMKHRVQAAADYKAAESQDADHTVLLKLKEGDEYKLVLNMQVCNLILRKHILVKSCIYSNTEALYCPLSMNF